MAVAHRFIGGPLHDELLATDGNPTFYYVVERKMLDVDFKPADATLPVETRRHEYKLNALGHYVWQGVTNG